MIFTEEEFKNHDCGWIPISIGMEWNGMDRKTKTPPRKRRRFD
jgi:hypothetical protein